MNFINKINKYLLERYPLIWNTRLIWMITLNILIHLLFFVIGYTSANEIADLKKQPNLSAFFYSSSGIYYNFLISIFTLLIWIVFYLRNNAFKNLYEIPKGLLFKQFCIILFIFFISTSQYFSFKQGLITKIKNLYSWQEVDRDIKTFNKAGLFLIQNLDYYNIDNKKYPKPFPLKVTSASIDGYTGNIDSTKSFMEHKGRLYQFYNINKELYQQEKSKKDIYNNIYYENNKYYNFKYRIVEDVSDYKILLNPSLLNYSETLFPFGQDSIAYQNQLKSHQKILENGDELEIKNELKNLIVLAKKYEINHNLTIDNWFPLVNNRNDNYLIKELINKSDPNEKEYQNNNYTNKTLTNQKFDGDIPYSKTLFFSLYNTDNLFQNIHESYFPKFESDFFYILVVFVIVLAICLFIFKTTNTKSTLLTFVASLVILVLIVWLMSFASILFKTTYSSYLVMVFISSIIIIFSFLSYILKWKKIITSIFWSLGLFAIPCFFFFTLLSYIQRLKNNHLELYPKDYTYKSGFEIWFDKYGFWLVILIWLVTVYIYSLLIRKLKARAE